MRWAVLLALLSSCVPAVVYVPLNSPEKFAATKGNPFPDSAAELLMKRIKALEERRCRDVLEEADKAAAKAVAP